MSFLAPLFLLGALAVAAPVLFHLVRRTTRERTIFSSLMFLRAAPPRLTRRNRLEHLLLLLLRCAVICLLALGFARPFWRQAISATPPSSEARRVVLLVDVSASMRRGNLWTEARGRVEAVLRQGTAADQVAVFAFDHQLTPLVTFEQWSATPVSERTGLVRSRLAGVSPGWGGSYLDAALIRAAELLAEAEEGQSGALHRQVVVVSDLQAGSRVEGLQAHEWPKGIDVRMEPLKSQATSNAGLQLAADAADAAPSKDAVVRLRVSNEPDSRVEQFNVGWQGASTNPGFVGAPLSVYIPAGQNRIISLPVLAEGQAAERIVLQGDDEPFDNTLFVIPPQPAEATVLYFGKEPPGEVRGARYFLERALQQTRRLAVRVIVPTTQVPISPDQVAAASLLVVTDQLPAAEAQAVAEAVRQGKVVLFAPKTPAAVSTLAVIPELASLAGDEGRFNNYGLLGEIDFRHPLFAPFADPRFSDFTKIHFWKYRRLNPETITGGTVLAHFDNNDPALIEVPAGKGRVFVLASGWHTADSQLALSSKFVPLLYSLLDLGGVRAPPPATYLVGDRVPIEDPVAPVGGSLVFAPGGTALAVTAPQDAFAETRTPGLYEVKGTGSTNRFAVNLDPAESRTTPRAIEDLERMGVPMAQGMLAAVATPAQLARLQSAELEGRQKLWRWLILVTLAVLLFETWLAGRTTRRSTAPMEATS